MKQGFLSFASRYVVAVLGGLALLMLHGQVGEGVLSILIPLNTSAWELGKIVFWPILLAMVILPQPWYQAMAQCVVSTVVVILLGWLCQSVGGSGVVCVVIWMVVVAISLAKISPQQPNHCWALIVLVLGVAFAVLSFHPVYYGPFLDPSDVATMAVIPW